MTEKDNDLHKAAVALGRKGGQTVTDKKRAHLKDIAHLGGRPQGRLAPRSKGEEVIRTHNGYYCADCGKWVHTRREAWYAQGDHIRFVCVACYKKAVGHAHPIEQAARREANKKRRFRYARREEKAAPEPKATRREAINGKDEMTEADVAELRRRVSSGTEYWQEELEKRKARLKELMDEMED